MIKIILVGATLLGAAGLAWSLASAEPRTISGPSRVTDGDTIVIVGTRIRLQGLDAEEMSMVNGPRAKAALRDIVGDHVLSCTPDGSRNHGRTVAVCTLPDGTDIARELIRRGAALDCYRYSRGRYRADEPVGVRQKLSQAPYC